MTGYDRPVCWLLSLVILSVSVLSGCGQNIQIGEEMNPYAFPEFFVSGPAWVVIPFWIGAIPGGLAGFGLVPLVSPFLLLVDERTLVGMSPLERSRSHVERAFLTPPLWVAVVTGTIVAAPFWLFTLPFASFLGGGSASIRIQRSFVHPSGHPGIKFP